MRLQLICSGALLLSGTALAQYPLQGFLYNWDRPQLTSGIGFVTRGTAAQEQVLCRYDRDDYKEWGLNGATPAQTTIQGFMGWIQDNNDATVEAFSLVGYNEDPARANFPLITTPVFNIMNIPMPPTGNPPAGHLYRMIGTFNTPFTFPTTGDIFLGVGVPALVNTQTNDGLWIGVASTNPLNPAIVDRPGSRGQFGTGTIANGSFCCFVINMATPPGTPVYGAASATSLLSPALDWMHSGGSAGGVSLTETNQTTYPSSNAPLGTSNFVSGLHPDTVGTNPGRADNIGFAVTVHNTQIAQGNPVFILMAFGPSPIGSTPIRTFQAANNPSSFGNVCIDFTAAATFLGILTSGGLNSAQNMVEAQVMLQLSPQTRNTITNWVGPLDIWWQGFAFDAASPGPGLEIRTTGCVVQHLK